MLELSIFLKKSKNHKSMMRIYLRRFVSRKELADRLGISEATLKRKMKRVQGIEQKRYELLDSEIVSAFFNTYSLSPRSLEDIADYELSSSWNNTKLAC
ncbi:helix-turn-helix domain-containing protein [Catalinimonas alkaloidigena]|uniref:helix-turn-helix domain-containing protein n=1 Tax=Catalinimonas alkaloidigena TaxID=1075417 RepID=UPI0024058E15|nr:helix-turn-helix domain-containing protein [Catalinimonas alkaloidigena]